MYAFAKYKSQVRCFTFWYIFIAVSLHESTFVDDMFFLDPGK